MFIVIIELFWYTQLSVLDLFCGATVTIAVIITFTGQSSSQPPTELKQVGPIYEEPEDFKPDPNTEGNVAYGHVQPLHSRH